MSSVTDDAIDMLNFTDSALEVPSLDELNSQEIKRLIPLIIYLFLVCVIGIFGNAIVCHIYRTKYRQSNSKYFILCLSVIDLFSCALVMPFEIWAVSKQYTFEKVWLCKAARFVNTLPTIASGVLLLVIAIDRYRKVCKPLRWQISYRNAKWICLGAIFCGVLVSWPALLLYGRKTFHIAKFNLTATECSTSDSMSSSIYPVINNAVFGLLFLFGTTSMTVLYTLIARQIKKHAQNAVSYYSVVELQALQSNNLEAPCASPDSQEDKAILDCSEDNSGNSRADTRKNRYVASASSSEIDNSCVAVKYTVSGGSVRESGLESVAENRKNESIASEKSENVPKDQSSPRKGSDFIRKMSATLSSCIPTSESSTVTSTSIPSSGTMSRVHRSRQRRARRMTLVMFLISLAFVLSYLPHVFLMLTRAVSSGFVDAMTDEGRAAYKFFLRSYALNCVVNPFIYSVCDKRFRKAVKQLFRDVFQTSESSV